MRKSRYSGYAVLTIAGLVFANAACGVLTSNGIQTKVTRSDPYADPNGTPTTKTETGSGKVSVTASASDEGIDVDVIAPKECRTVKSTPMVQDETTERTLSKTEKTADGIAIVGGVVAMGLGALAVWGGCEKDANPSTGGATGDGKRPCTDDEASKQKSLGYALLGGGALLVAVPLTVDGIASMDSTKTVATYPKKDVASKACGSGAVEGKKVVLVLPDGQRVAGTTDAKGHVRLGFNTITWTDATYSDGKAKLKVSGEEQDVSFASTPRYVAWKKATGDVQAKAEVEDASKKKNEAIKTVKAKAMRKAIGLKLIEWSKKYVTFSGKGSLSSRDVCLNNVDYEIPCNTPKGIVEKKKVFDWSASFKISNKSSINLSCTVIATNLPKSAIDKELAPMIFPLGPASLGTKPVPAGATVVFENASKNLPVAFGTDVAARCSLPVADAAKVLTLSGEEGSALDAPAELLLVDREGEQGRGASIGGETVSSE